MTLTVINYNNEQMGSIKSDHMKRLPLKYDFFVSFTSRENFLHLVSHEKFHFSRDTRTRRDLAHGYRKA
jgi:hypothetical protein